MAKVAPGGPPRRTTPRRQDASSDGLLRRSSIFARNRNCNRNRSCPENLFDLTSRQLLPRSRYKFEHRPNHRYVAANLDVSPPIISTLALSSVIRSNWPAGQLPVASGLLFGAGLDGGREIIEAKRRQKTSLADRFPLSLVPIPEWRPPTELVVDWLLG